MEVKRLNVPKGTSGLSFRDTRSGQGQGARRIQKLAQRLRLAILLRLKIPISAKAQNFHTFNISAIVIWARVAMSVAELLP